jgi:hypothetical protein
MGEEGRLAAAWRWFVSVFGQSWVFWPAILFLGLLSAGPGRWAASWMWVMALLVAGPVLATAIWWFSSRRSQPA